MLLKCHISSFCHKRHKYAHNSQAQRVFKTAPLFAQTNPDPTAPQTVIDAFTAYLESLWDPATAATQKAGMSYVYDEDGTLIAQTLTGGASTTWGQSARYIYLPTASGPLPVAAIYGTKHYAIQSDHLNTPRRLIQSDGQVAWQWAYSAFGDEQPTIAKNRFANTALNQSFGSTTVAAVTFNLRYPGQYFDQESDLHYNYHRSYSAKIGRYTQSDPIGLDGGWNRFGYAEQNPIRNVDPSGLIPDILEPIPGGLPGQYQTTTYSNCMLQCLPPRQLMCQGFSLGLRGLFGLGTATGFGMSAACNMATQNMANCNKKCNPEPDLCVPLPPFPPNVPNTPPILDFTFR